MAYATLAALTERYGESVLIQLTDRTGVGTVDAAVVGRACADADSEVDSYLGVRYAVPLAQAAAVVVRLACDIAYYRLHTDLTEEHPAVRGYQDALRLLRAYAGAGAVLSAAPVQSSPSAELVEAVPGRRYFGGGARW